jgi:hypothetical protein
MSARLSSSFRTTWKVFDWEHPRYIYLSIYPCIPAYLECIRLNYWEHPRYMYLSIYPCIFLLSMYLQYNRRSWRDCKILNGGNNVKDSTVPGRVVNNVMGSVVVPVHLRSSTASTDASGMSCLLPIYLSIHPSTYLCQAGRPLTKSSSSDEIT